MRRSCAAVLLILWGATSALPARAQEAPSPGLACRTDARHMVRLELLFGLSIPRGGQVSELEWAAFLAEEVTPRFPEGLTVLDAYGQWRGPTGMITREASKLVLILYVPDATSDERIEAIRAAYKTRFSQDSVMRIDAAYCVSF